MGHLVNPIAYRVGFSLTWDSNWYIKSLYYTEMLHWLLLVKPLLVFLFGTKLVLKYFIFSHYKLKLIGKIVYIDMHIYFSLYERRVNGVMDSYVDYQQRWGSIINMKGAAFSNYDYYKKRIIIYMTFVYLFMNGLGEEPLKRNFLKTRGKLSIGLFWLLSSSIDKGLNINFDVVVKLVKEKISGVKHKRGMIQRHINRIYLFLFWVKSVNKVLEFGSANYEKKFIRGLLSGFLYMSYLDKPMEVWSKYVNVLVSFLCKSQFDVISRVCVVRNNQITAEFITFFICKKLKLGFPYRPLINSLVGEFGKLRRLRNIYEKGVSKNSVAGSFLYTKKKFMGYYNVVKGVYKKNIYKGYLKSDTWWCLDYIVYIMNLRNLGVKCNLKILKKMWKSRFGFIIYYYNIYTLNNFFRVCKYGDSILLYKAISMNSVNYILFSNASFNVKLNYIKMSSLSYNFFLKYYYNSVLRLSAMGISSMKGEKRLKASSGNVGVKGFKILLCGRFSRKQRASMVCIVRGSIPLSTKMALIDYGFSTVPLINSLVSVKVWFYKG